MVAAKMAIDIVYQSSSPTCPRTLKFVKNAIEKFPSASTGTALIKTNLALLALVPQHEERGDHLLTDISDSLRVRGAVVLEGLL
jgi:hypothetical protein